MTREHFTTISLVTVNVLFGIYASISACCLSDIRATWESCIESADHLGGRNLDSAPEHSITKKETHCLETHSCQGAWYFLSCCGDSDKSAGKIFSLISLSEGS